MRRKQPSQDMPQSLTMPPDGYAVWLANLKQRIHAAQMRATLAVNQELILLYWHIGKEILAQQSAQGWGSKVIEQLANDLRNAFPEMKGFSRTNLLYMRAFAEAWPDVKIVQQAVGQLPWGHNLVLLTKLKTANERLAYAHSTIEHGWSRNALRFHIDSQTLERVGKAVTNFETRLPAPLSDLARESLKDPYRFDFLALGREAGEREIEHALTKHVTDFLLELGAGFAFVGRQMQINVGGEEFFLDLLFYHVKLRCYVVIEIKSGSFKPAHLGQLGFYLTAVDRQMKHENDNPSIGLLLCRNKNRIVAEYALADKSQPMGVAEFRLPESLPPELETSLPSIELIERELTSDVNRENEDAP
jgi:predicted nuclease of restriction endonuclease-like (RecB) superfamily